jgi:hypothetical protein
LPSGVFSLCAIASAGVGSTGSGGGGAKRSARGGWWGQQDFGAFVHKTFSTLSPGRTYVYGWHIRALAYHLERVRRGEIKRFIVNMPPRSRVRLRRPRIAVRLFPL